MSFIAIVWVIFTVYLYFKKPQDSMEIKQAVVDKEIDSKASILAQKEMENKANILAEQVKLGKESTDKKFESIIQDNKDAMLLATNHTHTVDVKVDSLIQQVNSMNLIFTQKFTELSTILEERLPKRNIK